LNLSIIIIASAVSTVHLHKDMQTSGHQPVSHFYVNFKAANS